LRKELSNLFWLQKAVRQLRPQLVYVWNYFDVSVSNLLWLQKKKYPLAYFVFDNWLAQWERDPWYAFWTGRPKRWWARQGRLFLRPLLSLAGLLPSRRSQLRFSLVHFGSGYLKDFFTRAGKSAEKAHVVHWGVDPLLFAFRSEGRPPRKLLFVGQVVPHKGVHVALKALGLLRSRFPHLPLTLTVVGGLINQAYFGELQALAREMGISQQVHFMGAVSRQALPSIYQDHDIFVFPSSWEEPLGIVALEAMACGLPVVGTGTGGMGEILRPGINSLVFPPENAEACAEALSLLLQQPDLGEKLRHAARRDVEELFSLAKVLPQLEASLLAALEADNSEPAPPLGRASSPSFRP
jgi:glycosyltransferase involved in cell wall biosynthesis